MDRALPTHSVPRAWLALAVATGVAVLAYIALSDLFLRSAQDRTPDRAEAIAATIEDALARLDHLPVVLAADPRVVAAVATGDGAEVNRYLEEVAALARAEVIYLMDATGLTVAASNHASPDSFVGESYTFRPYFRDAMRGDPGRFFAVGVTTGRPGYFVSAPVRDGSARIVGVAVVKIGVSALTNGWAGNGDQVLVTTSDGVVLAATDPAHLFRTVAPLDDAQRAALAADRQFDGADLSALDWRSEGDGRVRLDGTEYLLSEATVPREGWNVYLLSSVADLRMRALLFLALGAAAVMALAIVASLFRSAQLDRALAASNADRQRLSREIEERRRAEERLQATQAELQRASRLAALGQLSASITHELGQPISAMKNYLAAEELAGGAAPGTLNAELSGLVERMQSITGQLRFFATPSRRPIERVDLTDVAAAAIRLVAHDVEAAGIRLETDMAQGAAMTEGVAHRLEQVAVNLLRNAIHAVESRPAPCIRVAVAREGGTVSLAVTDNGTGLGGTTIERMTEPFVTTKSSGKGMGLGLAISAQIARDHGGRLSAEDTAGGGATVALHLPALGDAPA